MSDLSRRSLVTSAAALPALAVPAIATAAANLPAWQAPKLVEQPDPIFALIEQWKELDVLHGAMIKATDKAAAAGDYSDAVEAAYIAQGNACHEACEVAFAIFKTLPTTLAGMRAKIDFAFSVDHVTDLLMNNSAEDYDMVRHFSNSLYEAARLMAMRS